MATHDLTQYVDWSASNVTEQVMAQGNFQVQLDNAKFKPSLWELCEQFDYIIITPQWVDSRQFTDAAMLGFSRFTGVLTIKRFNDQGLALEGAGLHWLLGEETDEPIGPVLQGATSFSGSTLTSVFSTALAGTGLTSGTITTTGLGTYTGTHYFSTPSEIIRTACLSVGAEYRVNHDGTVDAGQKQYVYTITQPRGFVTRRGWGTDIYLKSMPVANMTTVRDSSNYIEEIIIVSEDTGGVKTETASQARSPAGGYLNLAGTALNRVMVASQGVTDPVSAATYALSELNQRSIEQRQDITTDHYEFYGGSVGVGDAFYCWDPPAFKDDTNPVFFRGDLTFPLTSRLLQVDWDLDSSMGVYLLKPEAAP